METIIKVGGMSCGNCVKAVKTAVEALAGVESAAVDLESGLATVTHDPAQAPVAAIKEVIESKGFDVLD
ncbi:MAG: cation transporter [Oscillospiraceae bacterium]